MDPFRKLCSDQSIDMKKLLSYLMYSNKIIPARIFFDEDANLLTKDEFCTMPSHVEQSGGSPQSVQDMNRDILWTGTANALFPYLRPSEQDFYTKIVHQIKDNKTVDSAELKRAHSLWHTMNILHDFDDNPKQFLSQLQSNIANEPEKLKENDELLIRLDQFQRKRDHDPAAERMLQTLQIRTIDAINIRQELERQAHQSWLTMFPNTIFGTTKGPQSDLLDSDEPSPAPPKSFASKTGLVASLIAIAVSAIIYGGYKYFTNMDRNISNRVNDEKKAFTKMARREKLELSDLLNPRKYSFVGMKIVFGHDGKLRNGNDMFKASIAYPAELIQVKTKGKKSRSRKLSRLSRRSEKR